MIFRTLSDRTTIQVVPDQPYGRLRGGGETSARTFILSDVFERKGQAGILALDDAHFTKGTFADDTQKFEMVEVHYSCNRFVSDVKS